MQETQYVLMIEDNPSGVPERIRDLLAERADIEADLLHPSDITEEALRAAAVVALDHRLDYWEERESLSSVALQPRNGIALAAVLRSCLAPKEIGKDVTAFCLLTGHPDDLAGRSPYERRPQVLARSKNLEWVFSKEQPKEIADQIASLAQCVGLIREVTGGARVSPRRIIETALGVDAIADLSDQLWASIERCQPPLVEIDEWKVPMCLVRWVLHRILPYPCFLLDKLHLAARLRVTLESLRACLEGDSEFAKRLAAYRYKGVLSTFDEQRWWRAAVDALIWELSDQGTLPREKRWQGLLTSSADVLEPLEPDEPVVCVDEDLMPKGIEALTDTVRLQPDDWPSYAHVPRALRESVLSSERLRLLVVEDDLELLEEDEDTVK